MACAFSSNTEVTANPPISGSASRSRSATASAAGDRNRLSAGSTYWPTANSRANRRSPSGSVEANNELTP
jgi:hypothetical protein